MTAIVDTRWVTAATSMSALFFDDYVSEIVFVPRVGAEPALVNDKKYKEQRKAKELKREKRLRPSHRCGRMMR